MSKPHLLHQSFLHTDPDFYCMIEQPEAPYHVRQTASRMMHLHQDFHSQIPKMHSRIRCRHHTREALIWQDITLHIDYFKISKIWNFFYFIFCINSNLIGLVSSQRFQQPTHDSTWYATSKKGMWFFSWMTSAIFCHCSGVGSIPVGLWAQPWSKMKDPSGAAWKDSNVNVYTIMERSNDI